MTRSRKRKLRRLHAAWAGVPLATSILAAAPPAMAQQQADTGILEEVLVTAQKREESLQNVPLSITAITTEKLEELHITNFDDYAQLIPSVSFQSFGPGFEKVYMRGVVNGGDGNHSGSLPSVGMYLDEQPITTIQGNLDIHLYDIARVEALAGPQGTLYGASSQAGTVRIITNKPDPSGFKASYNLQGTSVSGGDQGYTGEGFVNLPIGERAAVRIVGWVEHDPGYIDNVPGTITFPTSGICMSNTNPPAPGCQASPAQAKKNYNEVDTYGARAALKIDLNDSWTITPSVMGQKQKAKGNFAFNSASGDLKLSHFYPEGGDDRWGQAALTVEGKIGNFDLVYGGAFLKRNVDTTTDYTDYSFFYDSSPFYYGVYWYDSSGELINPSQHINGKDRYQKWSHELRVASPKENRFRFVAGAFMQRQQHGIEQRYLIDGLDPFISITGWPDTWWLTEQLRVDRDEAVFAEANFDFTDNATLTLGLRHFKYDNSLKGFFGFGANNSFWSCTGEAQGSTTFPPAGLTCAEKFPTLAACDYSVHLNGGPCLNLRKEVEDSGNTPKVSFSYKPGDNTMLYVTYSKGFRPGGVNRRGTLPPYQADFLKNYEFGWKSTIKDGRMRFNGAVFIEDWDNFQYSYLGANSLTQIQNAPAARIKGLEVDIDWAASSHLTVAGGVSFLEPVLTSNFCQTLVNGLPVTDCANPEAPSGTQLPVTPKFKANMVGRYKFNLGSFDAHVQGSFAYVGSRTSDLRLLQRDILGRLGGYLLADFTFGVENDNYAVELYLNNAFDRRGVLDKYAQCDADICGRANNYVNVTMPRTIGIQFSQKF